MPDAKFYFLYYTLQAKKNNKFRTNVPGVKWGFGSDESGFYAGLRYPRPYRGKGFLSFLSGIGRKILPFLSSAGKSLAKQGLRSAKRVGPAILDDILAGKNVKESLKSRLKDEAKTTLSDVMSNIGGNTEGEQSGSGYRKRKRVKRKFALPGQIKRKKIAIAAYRKLILALKKKQKVRRAGGTKKRRKSLKPILKKQRKGGNKRRRRSTGGRKKKKVTFNLPGLI
jgi:hypothetical protein